MHFQAFSVTPLFCALLHQAPGSPYAAGPSVQPPPPHPLYSLRLAIGNSSLAYRLAFVNLMISFVLRYLFQISDALLTTEKNPNLE